MYPSHGPSIPLLLLVCLQVGHSRGAKTSVLACVGDPRVSGLALIDPVDRAFEGGPAGKGCVFVFWTLGNFTDRLWIVLLGWYCLRLLSSICTACVKP